MVCSVTNFLFYQTNVLLLLIIITKKVFVKGPYILFSSKKIWVY